MTHETTHKPYGTLPGEHSRARGIIAATRHLDAQVRDRTCRRIVLALIACAVAMAIGAVCAARARELLRSEPVPYRMP